MPVCSGHVPAAPAAWEAGQSSPAVLVGHAAAAEEGPWDPGLEVRSLDSSKSFFFIWPLDAQESRCPRISCCPFSLQDDQDCAARRRRHALLSPSTELPLLRDCSRVPFGFAFWWGQTRGKGGCFPFCPWVFALIGHALSLVEEVTDGFWRQGHLCFESWRYGSEGRVRG